MSGFVGVIALDGAPADSALLERMAQTLAFRGPDGTHITTKPGAGFCFTFLRTGPAPQCPSQPCTLDGKVWLIGDVRLDGRDDLRRKLEQYGDEINAEATDEELLLRTWRRSGEEGIAELIGDYAFALWDAEQRTLRCWRDLIGARPFFYSRAGNRLYFSNTLNAIRCAPEISNALDEHFIGDFLLQGSCSYPERTAFKQIARLPAGYLLHSSGTGLDLRRFTSLPVEEPLWFKHEEEYVERFRELFEMAVRERLPAGSVAIFMSGGLDSSSVAATAVANAKKTRTPLTLRAYTVDYRPLFNDKEGELASCVARHLGISVDVWPSASQLPFADSSDYPAALPEPLHEPYHLIYLHQVRRIAQHARVVLTGYGGDTILSGQAWPYLIYLFHRSKFLTIAEVFGTYFLEHRTVPPLRGGFRKKVYRLFGREDPMQEYPTWLAQPFASQMNLEERWRGLQQAAKEQHPLHPNAYATLNTSFWPNLLETEDPAWNFEPIESRASFFDSRILRFLLRVPPVPWCVHKNLLRRAVRGLLPEQIRLRPKTPLQGDALSIQAMRGQWNPLPLPSPTDSILPFVNWDELKVALEVSPRPSLTANLQVLSLQTWLKGIENDHSFEYSIIKGKSD